MDSINDIPQHQLIHRALSSKQKKSSKSTRQVISLPFYIGKSQTDVKEKKIFINP